MSDVTAEMIALARQLLVLSWGEDAVNSLSEAACAHRSAEIAKQYSSEAELRAILTERRGQQQYSFRQAMMQAPRIKALDAAARDCVGDEYVDALMAYIEDYQRRSRCGVDTRDLAHARKLLGVPRARKMALLLYAYERSLAYPSHGLGFTTRYAMGDLVRELAKSAPRPSQCEVIALLEVMALPDREEWRLYSSPDTAVLTLCEKVAAVEAFTPETRAAAFVCLDRFDSMIKLQSKGECMSRDEQKFRARLWALGQSNESEFRMADTLWGLRVERELAAAPSDLEPQLRRLLQFASKGSGATAGAKWEKAARDLLAKCDSVAAAQALLGWVQALHPAALAAQLAPASGARDTLKHERAAWGLPSYHQEQARRMLWLAALADPARIAAPLEELAVRANAARHPQYGMPMSVIFAGAVSALAMTERSLAAPALLRLRRKMKSISDQKTIDKALASLANAAGVSVATLEEASVPDFGLGATGEIVAQAGAGTARIALEAGTCVSVQWIGADGKPRRNSPLAKNGDSKAAIAAVKAQAKEIAETLKSHAARLERLYLADHSWACQEWRRSFRDQPLLRHLSDALIWSFEHGGELRLALPSDDGLTDEEGRAVVVADDAIVRLWHPIGAPVEVVQAWRQRIVALQITQPVKQAYREVYLLTDAERATADYSNRFAAQIIRQSQFRALAKAREWRAPLSGYWDGDENPRRILTAHKLIAEFVTSGVDGPTGESPDDGAFGAFGLLATDRVRFTDSVGAYVALESVPAIVLSEIMRDVDLFVGVASIGADPTWRDQGANRRFIDRWMAQAFGELSGSAVTRRELIADLLPALSIADRCELTDRALVVKGKLNRYKIHLGSGNIMMEPGSRYLCIVPSGAGASVASVRLPFEGDAVLSIILSKAFLLAEDDKIKDRSIVSQIKPLV